MRDYVVKEIAKSGAKSLEIAARNLVVSFISYHSLPLSSLWQHETLQFLGERADELQKQQLVLEVGKILSCILYTERSSGRCDENKEEKAWTELYHLRWKLHGFLLDFPQ